VSTIRNHATDCMHIVFIRSILISWRVVNTQTHLLLATAVLLPIAPALGRQTDLSTAPATLKNVHVTLAALIGAMLPDASLFLMFFIAKAQGVPEAVIFNEWYFSERWQRLGAISNSLPIYAGVAILAYGLRARLITTGALAAFLHCLTDLPLHHDDGHPHFWPFSQWIYSSPISYWDPKHYGNQWGLFELGLAAVMIVWLWRRSVNKISRALLVLAALSYGAVAYFWFTAFG